MQNLLILNSAPEFLEKVSRALINTGHRVRARCNDPKKALSLVRSCQKSRAPVKVLLASAPMDDPGTMDLLQSMHQDFPDVATIVMKQSHCQQVSIDVFSARRNGRADDPLVSLDAQGLSHIMNDVVIRFTDQGLRGQAIERLWRRLREWSNSHDFIEKFLGEVLSILEVERGSIFFFDEDQQQMVLLAARSGNGLELVGLTVNLGEGVAGYVAREKKPLLVVSRDATPIPVTSAHGKYETESFISAPILNNGRLIGVLNLTEKRSRKPFNEKDLDIVMTILDQFSANIEQAFQQRDLRDKIKNLEKKVEGSQRKAEMGEMVAGVAHEINSALDGTMRFVNMALKKAAHDQAISEWLNEAKAGLERICRIVKPVNQYTRNGRKSFVQTNVKDVLHGVLILMSHKLSTNKVRVVKRFDSELPTIKARGDLDQVFINLIKNAIEAMELGGTLEIGTDYDKANMFIRFKDTGCGIPEEMLSGLCENGVTTKENGTGLGLSICKEIVRQHGGELKVESKVGVGSTFIVQLPLEQHKKGN